jgi:hypothetical protein
MQRGILIKMQSEHNQPVSYQLDLGNDAPMNMNQLIGKEIIIQYTGQIFCLHCGRKTKKSYGQGYCYPCFISVPETEECVLRPELCRAHEGIARDMEYAQNHCLQPHVVYLAETSQIKVGVTRVSQIPTRWIDQGARRVAIIARTPNRYLAGQIEVMLKNYFPDKTNWRDMLTNAPLQGENIEMAKVRALSVFNEDLKQYIVNEDDIFEFQYPVQAWPHKVVSKGLDKNPIIRGLLTGIRGQYLIFSDGSVINLRSYSGYEVEIEFE